MQSPRMSRSGLPPENCVTSLTCAADVAQAHWQQDDRGPARELGLAIIGAGTRPTRNMGPYRTVRDCGGACIARAQDGGFDGGHGDRLRRILVGEPPASARRQSL